MSGLAIPIALAVMGGGAGGSPGGLELVEDKIVNTDTQTVTFAGLDLDRDGIYLLVASIIAGAVGNNFTNFELRPNGTNTATGFYWRSNGFSAGGGGVSTTGWRFAQATGGVGDEIWAVAWIMGRSAEAGVGRRRAVTGTATTRTEVTNLYGGFFGGDWGDVGNMTSLDVHASNSMGIGQGSRLSLYRVRQ